MKSVVKEFDRQLLSAQSNLRSMALKLTSNPAEASDLVQDTTLKALKSQDTYAEKTNFSGWILTIMRNTFLNNCRSRKRTSSLFDTSDEASQLAAFDLKSESPTPDSVYNANELSKTISSLPDQFREPFSMLIEGYSYAEIAESLSLPLNIVKSRILNARRRLRMSLGEF